MKNYLISEQAVAVIRQIVMDAPGRWAIPLANALNGIAPHEEGEGDARKEGAQPAKPSSGSNGD